MSDIKRNVTIHESLLEGSFTPQEEVLEMPQKQGSLFIGMPKVQDGFFENRVALTPSGVAALIGQGHRVIMESGAGLLSRFSDHDYSESGAEISYSREAVFNANIILMVTPPSLEDIDLCHPHQVLISPIQLPKMTADFIFRLKNKRVIALAMDYLKNDAGSFPFVRMMSEMAGVASAHIAASLLAVEGGGRGVLLGGISGIPPARVVILGAGVVAEYATRALLGMGAEVRVFDNNIYKLTRLQHNVGRPVFTSILDPNILKREMRDADVAIGAIHAKQGRTPIIVGEDMVESMKTGAVIIDVSIDQGGCFATSHLTNLEQPTFTLYDVVHYCVPNIASRNPRTGSSAFTNILIPLLQKASEHGGFESLLKNSEGIQNGVYAYKSCLTNQYLSQRFNMKFTDLKLLLTSGF